MKASVDKARELLRVVMATEPREIDCDELLARIGAYLESRDAEKDVLPGFRAVAQHLEVCPECKEEFEALLVAHGLHD